VRTDAYGLVGDMGGEYHKGSVVDQHVDDDVVNLVDA
jgi:hypothetical protein